MSENPTPVADLDIDIDALSIHELREIAMSSLVRRARLREARKNYVQTPEAKANISKGVTAAWARRRAAENDQAVKS